MWDTIQKRNPVWYFDASGLFLNEINDQSKPFLFSIVSYDPNTKSFIPISDFFSTANDGLNIQLNLMRIQNILQRYKISYNPSIIVSDFSWANIKAILRTFLNCDVVQYLKICYQRSVMLDDSYDKVLKTKIYLCSTHFLKNVIDDMGDKKNSRKKLGAKVKTCFIFCFTLLQNSSTIAQFNDILTHFNNIFTQPKVNDSLIKSLIKIQFEIKTRNVNWLKSAYQYKERLYLNKGKDLRKEIIFENDFSENYKKDSPFTKYFEDLLKKSKNENSTESLPALPINEYYYPELMSIVTKRLHLAPLWSGFIISSELKNFPKRKSLNRLTNNPVEAWFGYFRNKILKINKRIKLVRRLNPSEIVTPYYNYLLMKFKKHYSDNCIDFSTFKSDTRHNSKEVEKWDFPGYGKSERIKGFYFSNIPNILNEQEIDEKKNNLSSLNELSDMLSIEEYHIENEQSNNIENSINRYTCFRILGSNLLFKDIYQLLNGEMINDLVKLNNYLRNNLIAY